MDPDLVERHTTKRQCYSQGPISDASSSFYSLMSRVQQEPSINSNLEAYRLDGFRLRKLRRTRSYDCLKSRHLAARINYSSDSRLPTGSYDSFETQQLDVRSCNSLELRQLEAARGEDRLQGYPPQELTDYDSLESLLREARNLRPLYENLYDYEAYGENAGEDEFIRRLKAFYRRHKPFFLLLEIMFQFGLCTLVLNI